MNIIEKAIELENKCKQQITTGETNTDENYAEFEKIAEELFKGLMTYIELENSGIEILKILIRIPDPEAVCGNYGNPLDFFEEYPDEDLYIYMNSPTIDNILKIYLTPSWIFELSRKDTIEDLNLEGLESKDKYAPNINDFELEYFYHQKIERIRYELAYKFLRSFIKV
ncbi:TPA: hypothetical protein N0H21_001281 [Pseudomonas aeruginosa]|nr:hypothetical protein [Pseudomonas aeruginosa]